MNRKLMVTIIAVLAVSVSLSGCETLRKKFTRQKKHDQNDDNNFVPVLEPQEYPAPENNPPVNYKNHYDLLKAWYRDLETLLLEKNADKRMQYTLKQVFGHLDEMQKLVVSEKQAHVAKLRGLLKYYNESLNGPASLRNVSRIQSDLRAFDRELRDELSPGKLQGSYVPAPAKAKSDTP